METVLAVYFCLRSKAGKFKIAQLPEKAQKIEILPRFRRWMKKRNILCVSFIILKIWKLVTSRFVSMDLSYPDDSYPGLDVS